MRNINPAVLDELRRVKTKWNVRKSRDVRDNIKESVGFGKRLNLKSEESGGAKDGSKALHPGTRQMVRLNELKLGLHLLSCVFVKLDTF